MKTARHLLSPSAARLQLIEAIGDQVSDRFANGIVDEIIEIFEQSGIVVFPE
jgi:hypothetical protein